MEGRPWRVMCCPPELRPKAIRRLHAGLPEDQQAGLLQALDRTGAAEAIAWEGLLIATAAGVTASDSLVEGVLWVQRVVGNTAMIWPPAADCRAAGVLYRAAAEFVDHRGIPLAQMVVAEQDGYPSELLQECGFAKLADLHYLFCDLPKVVERPKASTAEVASVVEFDGLRFESGAGEDAERLLPLLERTYVGTQDCADLDGVRPMDEVVEGYRNQGRYLPQHWHFVQDRAVDVGALLLSEHLDAGNMELVYMGVVPEARGRRIGERIARFALEAAARGGAERVVLAVDADNEPALKVYRRAGFLEWDRRTVYARLQNRRGR